MIINTNVSSMNTLRNLNNTENQLASSTAKLSSGFRINQASDDAAGLAIANSLRNTGAALTTASQNASQASSMLEIADGSAQQITQILDRMKQLATEASSANIGSDAGSADAEYTQLKNEIGRIISTTVYQGTNLLNGTSGTVTSVDAASTVNSAGTDVASVQLNADAVAGTYTLSAAASTNGVVELKNSGGTVIDTALSVNGAQSLNFSKAGITVNTGVGYHIAGGSAANLDTKTIIVDSTGGSSGLTFTIDATGHPTSTTQDALNINISGLTTSGLTNNLLSQSTAASAMGDVDTLLGQVNTALGTIGAAESRLSFASQNLSSKIQNTSAAESTIRDVDVASEMSNFSKLQILQQAGTAMLAQANSEGQSVLKLFQ
jgi:flagellin